MATLIFPELDRRLVVGYRCRSQPGAAYDVAPQPAILSLTVSFLLYGYGSAARRFRLLFGVSFHTCAEPFPSCHFSHKHVAEALWQFGTRLSTEPREVVPRRGQVFPSRPTCRRVIPLTQTAWPLDVRHSRRSPGPSGSGPALRPIRRRSSQLPPVSAGSAMAKGHPVIRGKYC